MATSNSDVEAIGRAVEVRISPHGEGDICWLQAFLADPKPDGDGILTLTNDIDTTVTAKFRSPSQFQGYPKFPIDKDEEVAVAWVPPKRILAQMVRPEPPPMFSLLPTNIIVGDTVEAWVPIRPEVEADKQLRKEKEEQQQEPCYYYYCWRRGIVLGCVTEEGKSLIESGCQEGVKIAIYFPSDMMLEAFPKSCCRRALEQLEGSWSKILPQEGCPYLDDVLTNYNLLDQIKLGTDFRKLKGRPRKSQYLCGNTARMRSPKLHEHVQQVTLQPAVLEPATMVEPMNMDANTSMGISPQLSTFTAMNSEENADPSYKTPEQESDVSMKNDAVSKAIQLLETHKLIATRSSLKPTGLCTSDIACYLKRYHILSPEIEQLLSPTLKMLVENAKIKEVNCCYEIAVRPYMEDVNPRIFVEHNDIVRLGRHTYAHCLSKEEKAEIDAEIENVANMTAEDAAVGAAKAVAEVEVLMAEVQRAQKKVKIVEENIGKQCERTWGNNSTPSMSRAR